MKIIYLITRSDVMGGASIHLLDLAAGAKALGHDVVIGVGNANPSKQSLFQERAALMGLECYGIKSLVREISPVKDISCYLELRAFLKAHSPDIVHVHSSKAGIIGRLAARSLSLPVVFTVHGWAFTEGVSSKRRFLYRWIERIMSRFASMIITVSDYDRKLAIDNKVSDPERMITVHNGMPESHEHAVLELHPPLLKLIMVARFEKPKNQASVLRAVASLKPENWSLELVGDGPELQENKKLAEQLNIQDRVFFPGACTQIAHRLANADVFILASDWEGLPLTILEAMRAGLPVVASNVGGVSEAVINNVTGLLVERGDDAGLTKAIARLMASPETRVQMGAEARSKFESEFTFDLMLRKTLNVYHSVLDDAL